MLPILAHVENAEERVNAHLIGPASLTVRLRGTRRDMAARPAAPTEARVAVLVDCDNTSPEILEYALRVVAQFGRVVLRRGYGNHATLANKWQEALVRLAFTPCLQYQYAAGKNTSDIALALDAMEALFDDRADTFCLVTSDSDFAYLCRKLRERGATVHIVGEEKTPDALRNASDQFFEWIKPASPEPAPNGAVPAQKSADTKPAAPKAEAAKPATKRRPLMVVEAVKLMAADTAEGKVHLGPPRAIPETHRPGVLAADLRPFRPAGHAAHLRLADRAAGSRQLLDRSPRIVGRRCTGHHQPYCIEQRLTPNGD
jgi:uncharacterized protein (TIGR00288 family)